VAALLEPPDQIEAFVSGNAAADDEKNTSCHVAPVNLRLVNGPETGRVIAKRCLA
jgi:hypothetical protein